MLMKNGKGPGAPEREREGEGGGGDEKENDLRSSRNCEAHYIRGPDVEQ